MEADVLGTLYHRCSFGRQRTRIRCPFAHQHAAHGRIRLAIATEEVEMALHVRTEIGGPKLSELRSAASSISISIYYIICRRQLRAAIYEVRTPHT